MGLQSLSIRNNIRWDLTLKKTLTLSQQTRELLQDLDQDVLLTLFFGGSPDAYQAFEDLFKRYTAESHNFRYRILYRDRNLGLAQQYQATHNGVATVEYNDQRKILPVATEELITQALFQFVHAQQKTIYFIGGHGEADPFSRNARDGYSEAAAALRNENFVIKPLLLSRTPGIPDDAALVILSGPRADLLPQEIAALERFLIRGGSLLVMIDPMDAPKLSTFLHTYGISLAEDLVYDPQNRLFGGDALSPIVSLYNTGVAIVKDFEVNTIFPLARSVEPRVPAPNAAIQAAPFCRTGPGSWARFNPNAVIPDGTLEFEGTKARQGPISLAVAATIDLDILSANAQASPAQNTPPRAKKEPENAARLVVYGDSDFASNARLPLLGNKDLFLNTVQWLVQEERFITQRPKDEETAPKLSAIFLTAQQSQQLFWMAVVGEPAVILLIGAAVSLYRRRKTV